MFLVSQKYNFFFFLKSFYTETNVTLNWNKKLEKERTKFMLNLVPALLGASFNFLFTKKNSVILFFIISNTCHNIIGKDYRVEPGGYPSTVIESCPTIKWSVMALIQLNQPTMKRTSIQPPIWNITSYDSYFSICSL
jgi:hypothetical protein